jgi:ribosomal protein L16 Arg81 hydroxylase
LAGLVDYSFAELVAMKRSYTRAFLRAEDGSTQSKALTAGEESSHYDAGWVIYFHSLRCTGMEQWLAAIDDDLGLLPGVTRVSAFASRRAAGLRPHYDTNDNFVCQARGAKRWRIARGRHVRFPTVGYTVGCRATRGLRAEAPADGLPDALPDHDTIELQPGDVMFVPRGTLHETETTENESIHFNIQAGLATWRDLLQFLVESSPALRSETLREPVLRMFDGAAIRPGITSELKDRLRAAVAGLCRDEVEIDREDFLAFMAKRKDAV